jgi:acyl-CoA-dependent ceramide synthase
MGTWIYLRHYINLRLLYAVLTEFRTVGPFELNWETQQYKCWLSQYITFGLLASLQAVNIFWMWLILRVLKRIVVERVEKDDRSDDEEEDEDAESETTEGSEEQSNLEEKKGAANNGTTPLGKKIAKGEKPSFAEVVTSGEEKKDR